MEVKKNNFKTSGLYTAYYTAVKNNKTIFNYKKYEFKINRSSS